MYGSRNRRIRCRSRKGPLKYKPVSSLVRKARGAVLTCTTFAVMSCAAAGQGPGKITLDDAIRLALEHNHNLLAARTTIQQNEAQEITANLKPNPVLLGDAQFLPIFQPSNFSSDYI